MQSSGNPSFAEKFFTPVRFGILLALLVFAAFPQVILGLESFVARDFGFFVYPLAHFQQDCFWRGELPFWNPYNNCGVPFLAQWNTMPLYPPSLLYLTLPLEWSLSFFSLAHLWWAGIGMYFLARRWTRNDFAAAFAGVAFAFNGFTLNLLMWPSHIATFSWLPWVVLAAELAWREGGRKIFLAGIVGALQMLAGGPETILLTWLIVSALWLQQFITGETPREKMFWRFPVVVALVFALSAAQLLPFLDLVAHAQRESGYTDLRWSMPGFGLANFLVPLAFGNTSNAGIFFQHGQYWTSSYYLGLGTLWLALLAFWTGRNSGESKLKIRLLAIIGITGLLCALGDSTPFYPLVRKIIPQLSFITYPIKFVMVVVFAAPLLAAFVLARYFSLSSPKGGEGRGEEADNSEIEIPSPQPSPRLGGEREKTCCPCDFPTSKLVAVGVILLALIGGIIFWTQHAPLPGDETRAALFNGFSRAIFLLLTGAVLFALTRAAQSPLLRCAPLALLLVVWLDVITHQPKQNPTVSPAVFELNLARTKLAMQPQPELGGSRAMLSPDAALELTRFAASDAKNNFLAKRLGYCANANLLDNVPKVDGFFSLTPREFDGFSTDLIQIYHSTLFGSHVYGTNAHKPFSHLLNFMGVSQFSSIESVLAWTPRQNFSPLVTAGQRPVFVDEASMDSPFLTHSEFDGSKMVFLPASARSLVTVTNQTTARILNSTFTTQTVEAEVEAAEPSLVVVAQTYYHNWHVTIDGQPASLLRANVAFQAVQVPAGKHRLHFFYLDRAFAIGAAISGIAWLGSLFALCWLRRKPQTVL